MQSLTVIDQLHTVKAYITVQDNINKHAGQLLYCQWIVAPLQTNMQTGTEDNIFSECVPKDLALD